MIVGGLDEEAFLSIEDLALDSPACLGDFRQHFVCNFTRMQPNCMGKAEPKLETQTQLSSIKPLTISSRVRVRVRVSVRVSVASFLYYTAKNHCQELSRGTTL